MTDTNRIITLLEERSLTHGQIANICQCSIRTVDRVSYANGLGVGRGTRNFWKFKETSAELAYIIGAYITDGTILKNSADRFRGVALQVTDIEFADRFGICLTSIGLKTSRFTVQPAGLAKLEKYTVSTYCKMFAEWISDICNAKDKIPDIINKGSKAEVLAFISAVIDGDGGVLKDGTIRVRSTTNWILDLPNLLIKVDIRTSQHTESTPNGKPYYFVSVNRTDFLAAGGRCAIPRKFARIAKTLLPC